MSALHRAALWHLMLAEELAVHMDVRNRRIRRGYRRQLRDTLADLRNTIVALEREFWEAT